MRVLPPESTSIMSIEIVSTDPFIFVKLHGTISNRDILQIIHDSEALAFQHAHSMDCITDLSDVTHFDLDYRNVFRLADWRKQHPPINPVKLAIIAQKPVQVGMAHMYQTLTETNLIQIQIVTTLDEAQTWIGVPHNASVPSAL